MRLRASTFISVILLFLGFLGAKNESLIILTPKTPLHFTNIYKDSTLPASTDAKTVEVFDGLKCKACDSMILETLPQLQEAMKKKNIELKITFVPEVALPDQALAALGLKCAAEQNKFLDYLKSLHQDETGLSPMGLAIRAQKLDLSVPKFKECMQSERHLGEVSIDTEHAKTVSVFQKPTTIIGSYRLLGNQPVENILKVLKTISEESKITPAQTL